MRSTFAGFYIAKSGIDSARANLDITGQNVSNENVTGYTRQRVDVYSRGSSGFNMRYASVGSVAIGEGVNLGGTSQLRDPYLDVRYRREQAKFGKSASELATLKDMEYIFDEIAKDGLDTQFQDFFKQLQNMALNNGDTVSENILKTSSKMLVKMFNYCSSQLEKVKLQEYSYLEDSTKRVNEILSGIADLNKQIKEANIGDNPALELIDSRNMLIDELSGYIPIETQTKLVNIGGGKMVEELSISLVTNGVDKFNLVDNLEYRQLGIVKDSEKNIIQPVKLQLFNSDGSVVGGSDRGEFTLDNGLIGDFIDKGSIAGHLNMLNNAGEFDMPAGSKNRGIQYYEKMLDTLANEFATSFNKANSTNEGPNWDKPMFEAVGAKPYIDLGEINKDMFDGYKINISYGKNPSQIDKDNKVITINLTENSTNEDLLAEINNLVKNNSGVGQPFEGITDAQLKAISIDGLPKNAIKFGNDMNTVKISAKNISVSQKWINTQGGYITMTKENQSGDSNAPIEGSNLQYMISLLEKEFAYTAEGSNSPIFKGTFQNFFTNISTTLGIEQKEISRQYDSYGSILIDIDKQRMSVSSVDINEEVMNMMKYNQSLNASSRMMTTLDEAIDVIVNKMGLVGR